MVTKCQDAISAAVGIGAATFLSAPLYANWFFQSSIEKCPQIISEVVRQLSNKTCDAGDFATFTCAATKLSTTLENQVKEIENCPNLAKNPAVLGLTVLFTVVSALIVYRASRGYFEAQEIKRNFEGLEPFCKEKSSKRGKDFNEGVSPNPKYQQEAPYYPNPDIVDKGRKTGDSPRVFPRDNNAPRKKVN